MSPTQAIAFVKHRGVVLEAVRGPVPSLAEAIAGESIRGSWWGYPKGRIIFRASRAICESPDLVVCKLVEGKITYVHRRLWLALVKLESRFGKEALAKAGPQAWGVSVRTYSVAFRGHSRQNHR